MKMKFLIIKPSSLGDIIHSLPFLKAIKDTFKDAHVDWVISKNLKEILEGNPLIDRLIVFDKDSWRVPGNFPKTAQEVVVLIKTLKAEHYDMVVDLQGLLRSGLITFFARSPLKIGFRNAREGSKIFYNRKITVNGVTHAVDRYMKAANFTGAQLKKVEFPLYKDSGAQEKINCLIGGIRKYVVIAPSARWVIKRWPAENFGKLITLLSVPCVITGSATDSRIVKEVMAISKAKGIDLCGKTGLKELVALIAGAHAVVSNDSGPVHIAVALGVPVIALFGPTDPVRTGPYGWSETQTAHDSKKLKVIRALLPCSPCFKKRCKDPLCMSSITTEKVFQELKEFL